MAFDNLFELVCNDATVFFAMLLDFFVNGHFLENRIELLHL